MIIYLIRNKINGKCYVGLDRNGNNSRLEEHIRRSKKDKPIQLIDRKIKEYGIDNFDYLVICECSNISELKEREVYYIKQFNSYVGNGNGYNLTFGGDGSAGFKLTPEQIAKVRAYHKGKRFSQEHKDKISASMKGKNAGDNNVFKRSEIRTIISEFAKTRLGELNHNYRHGRRCGVNAH